MGQNQISVQLSECVEELNKFKAELQNRLNLWVHMNEWIQFDTHVLQHNWLENVVNAGNKASDEEEVQEGENKENDSAEQDQSADAKKDQATDEQTEMIQRIYSMDAEKCCQYIQEMYRDANKIAKQLEGNEVASYYKSQVKSMKSSVQIMMELGNPNLKEQHWEEIFTIMDAPQFSFI